MKYLGPGLLAAIAVLAVMAFIREPQGVLIGRAQLSIDELALTRESRLIGRAQER